MSFGLIEIIGEDHIMCSVKDGAEATIPFATAKPKLLDWTTRYANAAAYDREAEFADIGREMFAWLDEQEGWASAWADGPGDRALEIRARPRDDQAIALLDAPWELLASRGAPLAQDALQPFVVARRIGKPGTPWKPGYRDIQLMFMAAAPSGQVELDFEQEEAGILGATSGDGHVHVIVEETGALNFLGKRLASEEGPFEAVHLSCHGDVDAKHGPVLLLETPEGDPQYATPAQVVDELGASAPPLVVLSACRTAVGRAGPAPSSNLHRDAAGDPAGHDRRHARLAQAGPDIVLPFTRQLTTQVANVLGWDGSVYD